MAVVTVAVRLATVAWLATVVYTGEGDGRGWRDGGRGGRCGADDGWRGSGGGDDGRGRMVRMAATRVPTQVASNVTGLLLPYRRWWRDRCHDGWERWG